MLQGGTPSPGALEPGGDPDGGAAQWGGRKCPCEHLQEREGGRHLLSTFTHLSTGSVGPLDLSTPCVHQGHSKEQTPSLGMAFHSHPRPQGDRVPVESCPAERRREGGDRREWQAALPRPIMSEAPALRTAQPSCSPAAARFPEKSARSPAPDQAGSPIAPTSRHGHAGARALSWSGPEPLSPVGKGPPPRARHWGLHPTSDLPTLAWPQPLPKDREFCN